MVKKREGYKIIVPQEYTDRIATGLCPVCSKPQNEWQRSKTWRCCSKECTIEYGKNIFWGWPALRRAAIKRDGKCVKCGRVETITKELMESDIQRYYDMYEIVLLKTFIKYEEKYDDTTWEVQLLDMSKYVVDHIVPISMSGDEWAIENLQTLCQECNKIKTRIDMGNIAKLRLKEKFTDIGQKFLEDVAEADIDKTELKDTFINASQKLLKEVDNAKRDI